MAFVPVNPTGHGNRDQAMLAFDAKGFKFLATLTRNLNLTEREAQGRKLGSLFDLRITATSQEDPELTHTVYKRGFHEILPSTTPFRVLSDQLRTPGESSWIGFAKEALRAARKAKSVEVKPEVPPDPVWEVTLTIPVVKTGTVKIQAPTREAARELAIQAASDSKAAGFVELPSGYTRSEFALASDIESSILQVQG